MRLVLHIGMGKTGTSTLQGTFRRERKLLATSGVLYPTSDRSPFRHHQALMCLVAPPEELPREFAVVKGAGARAIRRTGEEFWEDLLEQIDVVGPTTVVLSYESLLYLAAEQVCELQAIMAEVFTEIDVVAYVRHPSSHWLARTQQGIKTSYDVTPPGEYHNAVSGHLQRFVDAFEGRVHARAFDPLILKDRCIVRDFLAAYLPEASSVEGSITVTNVNESISAEAMCVMQDFHRFDRESSGSLFSGETRELLEMLALVEADVPQTTPRLRPGIAEQLVRNHRAELDWLEANFRMDFPSWVADAPVADSDLPSAASSDLREILDVDAEQVSRTIFTLLRKLSARSLALRALESDGGGERIPAVPATAPPVSATGSALSAGRLAASARDPSVPGVGTSSEATLSPSTGSAASAAVPSAVGPAPSPPVPARAARRFGRRR